MRSGLSRFKGSLAILATLFVVMFVGAALTGGFYFIADGPVGSVAAEAADAKAAAIARSGLELALSMADPDVLSRLSEGADTIVMHATVSTLDGTRGSFTVRAVRAAPARGSLLSTGALEVVPSGRCTARLDWDLPGKPPSPAAAASAVCVPERAGAPDVHGYD